MNTLSRTIAGTVSAVLVSLGLAVVPAAAFQAPAPVPSDRAMPSVVPSNKTPGVDDAEGDVRAIAKVGSTMVIGGNFTTVAGQARSNLYAFNVSTGALLATTPAVNGEVMSILPGPTATTAYVGGEFTQVGTTAVNGLALIDLTTGAVVSSFKAPSMSWARVNDMVKVGNHLIIVGPFTKVGGQAHGGIASLNATTGAAEHTFITMNFTGHHNDSGSGAQGPVGPWNLDVTPDGSRLVVIGNFKYVDGTLRDQAAQLDIGATAVTLNSWMTSRYSPLCYSWAFDSYTRGVSFSPDGSYFVIASTGGGNNTLCDAAARFELNSPVADAQPTWITQTGGDTTWAVEITESAVYVGGHQRWANNPLGVDRAKEGAVPRPGLMALDPVSGRPLAWNPGRNPAGKAVYAILNTSEGLWIGSNTDWIGNREYRRPKLALFPYTGGTPVVATTTASLPATIFLAGGGSSSTSNVYYRINAGGGALAALDSGPSWSSDTSSNSSLRNSGSRTSSYSAVGSVDASVPVSTPTEVFSTERYDPVDWFFDQEMEWSFPITAGTPVTLRAYFADRSSSTRSVGSRVFSVTVNGQAWLNNLDIVAEVGHNKGMMRSVDLTVPSSGVVKVRFVHNRNNPLINAFELVNNEPAPTTVPPFRQADFTGSSARWAPFSDGSLDWTMARAAFMVGDRVFFANASDTRLNYRTFDGTSFGPSVAVEPYHDPLWKDVTNNLNGTYDGMWPTLYGSQMTRVTGMFYNRGHLYYTLSGDSALRSRWFSPDSGIMEERIITAPSSVSFSGINGMFAAGGKIHYVQSDGTLWAADFTDGAVTGTPAQVSGPGIDTMDWRNRMMFAYSGARLNLPPIASFTATCTTGTCTFDGTASTDGDGSIASLGWDFGDGGSATGMTVDHTFRNSGTYTVTLTVTDSEGDSASSTQLVTVTRPANELPTASFTTSCAAAACTVDAAGAADPDGSIAAYAWDFGDGTSGSGVTASHVYETSGDYLVTLTVTDDRDGVATATETVTATVPANVAPTATFSVSCDGARCSVDGSASSDSEGSVVGYEWAFGDGTTGSGATAVHTFAASGSFEVTLTVTDDDGATASTTIPVTVTMPTTTVSFVGASHSAAGVAMFKSAAVPLGTAVGDTMLLVFSRPTTASFTGPTGVTGWTEVGSVTRGTVISTVWKKLAGAADVAGTVRFTDTAYRVGSLNLAVYRGVNADGIRVASAVSAGRGTITGAQIDARAGDLVATYFGEKGTNSTSWTAPAGLVVRDSFIDTGSGRYSSLVVDTDRAQVSSGLSDPLSAVIDGTTDVGVSWSFALPSS